MNDFRLPEIFFCVQLQDGEGLLSGGQECSFKRAVVEDLERFGQVRQESGEKTVAFEKRRANFIFDLAQDRVVWRYAVKVQGVDGIVV
jgi:hypothetical protein